MWDVASGKQTALWEAPFPTVRSLVVSEDGNLLAVTGSDGYDAPHRLRLIEPIKGRVVKDFDLTGHWVLPCFHGADRRMLVDTNGELSLWEVPPPKK